MNEISNNKENNRDKKKEPLLRRAMDAFGTIFALNICFVVGCIPIFTIGASLAALYAMCIRLQEDEEETVVAGFIHEFKRSFKQSTIAFLLIALALFVMFFEFLLVKKVTGFISTFYTFVLVIECVILALIVPFLFPLISRYNNKLSVLVRNSIILAITYLGSWIKVVVAWFAPIAFCVIYPTIFVSIWYLWLLFIFGAIAYGTSYTMRKIFKLNEQRIVDSEKAKEEAEKEEIEKKKGKNKKENNSEEDSEEDIACHSEDDSIESDSKRTENERNH